MSDEQNNGAAASQEAQQPVGGQLNLQKIYIKDASFEAPNAPDIFREEGTPELQMNMGQKIDKLADDVFQVELSITITCKIGEKTAYLAEVHQAGIFGVANFDDQATEAVLSTYCPNVLYPYVRQAVANLIQDGGFPPYLLQPINFDQIYAEQLRRRAEQQGVEAPAAGNA